MERIVVGISNSANAGRTLAWALREAAVTGREVTVVRADAPRRFAERGVGTGDVKALELIDPALARAVVAARLTMGEHRVAVVVDPGPAGEVLLSVATPEDVVVIGPPTRSGWWARASTTYRIATRAHCAVVVVHAPATSVAEDGVGRFLRSHVVVGVDGSPPANPALGFGFSFALQETLQFAGAHVVTSLFAFNAGVELGQLLVLVILVPLLSMAFRYVMPEKIGVIILSALVAHTAWHWMVERGSTLGKYDWSTDSMTLARGLRWTMVAVGIAAAIWLMSTMRSGRAKS